MKLSFGISAIQVTANPKNWAGTTAKADEIIAIAIQIAITAFEILEISIIFSTAFKTHLAKIILSCVYKLTKFTLTLA